MTPTLILVLLLVVAVAVVVWMVRRKPARPYADRQEKDTAWNDPVSPGAGADPSASSSAVAPSVDPTTKPSEDRRA